MAKVKPAADKRFKRGRVKTPRKATGRWRGLVRPLVKWTIVVAIFGYATARTLALVTEAPALRISHVAVSGTHQVSRAEILRRVQALDGENIVRADLAAARRSLLGSPWIEDATLRRRLPSTIEVQITERAPIGVARLGRGGLHLVAADGTVLGPYGASAAYDLPIVDGLPSVPGRALSGSGLIGVPARVDPEHADLAARVVTALQGEPELLKLISQMDVSDIEDAVVLLGDDPARVHLGHDDFARRVRAYRDLAPTLLQHVDAIDSADVRYDGRVFVRPARGRAAAPDQP
jgi:cell division protein FtsQ